MDAVSQFYFYCTLLYIHRHLSLGPPKSRGFIIISNNDNNETPNKTQGSQSVNSRLTTDHGGTVLTV